MLNKFKNFLKIAKLFKIMLILIKSFQTIIERFKKLEYTFNQF